MEIHVQQIQAHKKIFMYVISLIALIGTLVTRIVQKGIRSRFRLHFMVIIWF